MKRILVHGNKRVKECNECGCIFTYEKEDVITEQGKNFIDFILSEEGQNVVEENGFISVN